MTISEVPAGFPVVDIIGMCSYKAKSKIRLGILAGNIFEKFIVFWVISLFSHLFLSAKEKYIASIV